MYELPKDQMSNTERAILRKLRIWIVALGVACLVAGIAIGAILAGRPAVAQNDTQAQIARTPEALSASFAEIAKRVEPAVVNIDTVTAVPEVAGRDEDEKDDPSSNNPLLDMFRRQARRPARGVGSGFIVDPKGYILTNQHVVQGATRITVRLQTGEEFRGVVKGVDEETDLAVVKVETTRDLPVVKLGDSNTAQVGDWVLAIGSPFGLDQTVTAGIISTKERQTPLFTSFQQFLQTDAAINRGNSGGPLVNMRGEVIGINSQIATSTGDYNGIGFALPSNEAAFVYQQIVSQGRVRRGYLGIFLDSVKAEFARVYGLPEAKGAVVTDVRDPSGPAGKAGIQANDIIVEFNGQPIANAQDLIGKVAATAVGSNVTITYLRDVGGKLERRTANVTIGERPSSLAQSEEEPTPPPKEKETPLSNRPRLGLMLMEITPQIAKEKNLQNVRGLLVKEVDPNGIAADAGARAVREGEVIQRINRVPVATLAEFQRVVDSLKPGDAVVLHIASYSRDTDRVVQRIV
ncbi:MAG: Do family serine endopeptidase, partial [Pyrinomonadaceae bacterium]|nr:Do family serine endopeptidase [Pyrinomonadaceae bacterium]